VESFVEEGKPRLGRSVSFGPFRGLHRSYGMLSQSRSFTLRAGSVSCESG
jgi:hypothetical protein